MRVAALVLSLVLFAFHAQAAPGKPADFSTSEQVLTWINAYRHKPEPQHLPAAVQALSRYGAFRDPESSGVYVGFISGVLGANPDIAGDLIARSFPVNPEDQWVMVRAIAHSGLPHWKHVLAEHAFRMPTRRVMIAKYVDGSLPTLNDTVPQKPPSVNDKLKRIFTGEKAPGPAVDWKIDASPEVLDMLWGKYFATGDYGPIVRIVGLLPFSADNENIDKLTLGAMAKYTLASNSARNPDLLAILRRSAAQRQPPETLKPLKQIIEAADTMQLGAIRKEALGAIEDLKRKGPGSKRDLKNWGTIGEGAIALGCIGAAAAGALALGLPCVVGGAITSAALKGLATQ